MQDKIENHLDNLPSRQLLAIGVGDRIVERWGATGNHISRGRPQPLGVNLDQARINLLYHAANTQDNDTLRATMKSDNILKQILIN